MPAYNFQYHFADKIESGEKRQTIRPIRKHSPQPGSKLYLYTGLRTKQSRKLREATCQSVTPIDIGSNIIRLDGRFLSESEIRELTKADGFENPKDFFEFFHKTYGLPVKDCMELIKW